MSARILIVGATPLEVAPLIAEGAACGLVRIETAGASPAHDQRVERWTRAGQAIDLLITGVGMVATAAWCSRRLAETEYDFALNVGVCGSFDPALPPGSVVHVVADRLVELGAEDGERFLPIDELQLLTDRDGPAGRAELINTAPPNSSALEALPAVRGITVNTVHGNEATIAAVVSRCSPQVESMEGAAFMYACLIHGVRFAQVRAVSNVVEKRNRAAWRMAEAVDALGRTVPAILDTLSF